MLALHHKLRFPGCVTLRMTASSARKKRAVEPKQSRRESLEQQQRSNGLWIDRSLLPTNLARKSREFMDNKIPELELRRADLSADLRIRGQLVQIDDVIPGSPKSPPPIAHLKQENYKRSSRQRKAG